MDHFVFAHVGTFGFWIPHVLVGLWFLMLDILQPQWYQNRVVTGPVRLTKDSAKQAAVRVAPRLVVNIVATLLFTMWIEFQFGSWIKTNLVHRAEHINSQIQTFLLDHIASYSLISFLYSKFPWTKYVDQTYFIPLVWQSLWALTQLFCAVHIASFWFYTFHRLFHHPRLYTWHKLHHEFSVPVALAAMYVSVPEMLLVNIVPTVLGACLTGMNVYVFSKF